MTTILIADHDSPSREKYVELLPGFTLCFKDNLSDVGSVVAQQPDIAVSIVLWQPAGAEIVTYLKRHCPKMKIIAVDETLSRELYNIARQCGADEFLTKPLDESLTHAVQRALGEEELRHVVEQLQQKLVGKSLVWRLALEKLFRALRGDRTQSVLITGETGTGKELAARAIHEFGEYAKQPFLGINAAAVQPHLLESELFGHEKGSFTGANERRIGVFEQCETGTLFLDEIGELPDSLQSKLLRVIQERQFRRLGGNNEVEFQGRLVLATNKNLKDEVKEQRFRADLLHRINTHHIHLPALRERENDWLLLADHFLAKHGCGNKLELSAAVRAVLADCEFEGNTRQLEHAIEYCLTHRPIRQVLPGHLPPDLLAKQQAASSGNELIFPLAWLDRPQKEAMEELENTFNRQYLPRALKLSHDNVSKASERAGFKDPKTFRAKWTKAGLPPLDELD